MRSPRAMSCPPRRGGGTVSSGVLRRSRFCSRPTNGRRTPARRSGRHWWRSVTGGQDWAGAGLGREKQRDLGSTCLVQGVDRAQLLFKA